MKQRYYVIKGCSGEYGDYRDWFVSQDGCVLCFATQGLADKYLERLNNEVTELNKNVLDVLKNTQQEREKLYDRYQYIMERIRITLDSDVMGYGDWVDYRIEEMCLRVINED